jgi:hypothetical protein
LQEEEEEGKKKKEKKSAGRKCTINYDVQNFVNSCASKLSRNPYYTDAACRCKSGCAFCHEIEEQKSTSGS